LPIALHVRVRGLRHQSVAQAIQHLRQRDLSLAHPLLGVRRNEHSAGVPSRVAYQATQVLVDELSHRFYEQEVVKAFHKLTYESLARSIGRLRKEAP